MGHSLGNLVALAFLLWAAPCSAKWPLRARHADDVPASFDCAMRKLAYAYGKKLVPRQGSFESLFYALDLNEPNCTESLGNDEVTDRADLTTPLSKIKSIDVNDAILVSP